MLQRRKFKFCMGCSLDGVRTSGRWGVRTVEEACWLQIPYRLCVPLLQLCEDWPPYSPDTGQVHRVPGWTESSTWPQVTPYMGEFELELPSSGLKPTFLSWGLVKQAREWASGQWQAVPAHRVEGLWGAKGVWRWGGKELRNHLLSLEPFWN